MTRYRGLTEYPQVAAGCWHVASLRGTCAEFGNTFESHKLAIDAGLVMIALDHNIKQLIITHKAQDESYLEVEILDVIAVNYAPPDGFSMRGLRQRYDVARYLRHRTPTTWWDKLIDKLV